MKQLVLIPNESHLEAVQAAASLATACALNGCACATVSPSAAAALDLPLIDPAHDPIDLVIAFGGDGTLLRAAHLTWESNAPLLGIKFGRLGFLTGATEENALETVQQSLEGEMALEHRALIHYRARTTAGSLVEGDALNEIIVGRGQRVSTVTTTLSINNQTLYTSSGDGLIVASATGSTAYALSAGGPVVSPGFVGMVVVPLASHTLVQRAIVTAPEDQVTITLNDPRRTTDELVVDGHTVVLDGPVEYVECHVSNRSVTLIKSDDRRFYETVAREFFHGNRED